MKTFQILKGNNFRTISRKLCDLIENYEQKWYAIDSYQSFEPNKACSQCTVCSIFNQLSIFHFYFAAATQGIRAKLKKKLIKYIKILAIFRTHFKMHSSISHCKIKTEV